MSTETRPPDLAAQRSLLTLTKQPGPNGDAGGGGSLPAEGPREQVYTLSPVLLEGRVGKWGTACGGRGAQKVI